MRFAAAAAITAASLVAVGCGSDPDLPFAAEGAWARPTPAQATNGVVYLTLTSDVADELVAAEVDSAVAATAELHTSNAADGGGHSHGASTGAEVTMQQVEAVPITANGRVVFKPGGNHIMLVGLSAPLSLGDRFDIILRFTSGRELVVPVTVADNPPG